MLFCGRFQAADEVTWLRVEEGRSKRCPASGHLQLVVA